MPLKVFLLMNGILITQYFIIGDIDFRFKGLHAPFSNIRPKLFVKYILYYKDKQRGMVNICFWAEIYVILIFILSNIGLFLIHQFNLFSTDLWFWVYGCIVALIVGFASAACSWAGFINNVYLQKKYEERYPKRANRHRIRFIKRNTDNRKTNKEWVQMAILEEVLKKYCNLRENQTSYVSIDDLERIRAVELPKYKNAREKIELDEKGQKFLIVYDKKDDYIIFNAPIKEN